MALTVFTSYNINLFWIVFQKRANKTTTTINFPFTKRKRDKKYQNIKKKNTNEFVWISSTCSRWFFLIHFQYDWYYEKIYSFMFLIQNDTDTVGVYLMRISKTIVLNCWWILLINCIFIEHPLSNQFKVIYHLWKTIASYMNKRNKNIITRSLWITQKK